jgi:hypothetical protein
MPTRRFFQEKTKMRNYLLIPIFAAVAILSLSGCRTAPIYNVANVPVQMKRVDYTLEDVEKAIIRAGSCLRWMEHIESGIISSENCARWAMRKEKPGLIQATLSTPDYSAKVSIIYSTNTYSIHYSDSWNLDYKSGKIHKDYNVLIHDLDRAISRELMAE